VGVAGKDVRDSKLTHNGEGRQVDEGDVGLVVIDPSEPPGLRESVGGNSFQAIGARLNCMQDGGKDVSAWEAFAER
jgi:hypothetical protein